MLEIDRKVVGLNVKFDNVMEQVWFNEIKKLFQLVDEHGSQFSGQILRLLILETGNAMERIIPYEDFMDKILSGEIKGKDVEARAGRLLHHQILKTPFLPRNLRHPIIRPVVRIKKVLADYLKKFHGS